MDVINTLDSIHRENATHRDLHSRNILYSKYFKLWYVSDFGFCGPTDKPLGSIYGNPPYVAPEVLAGGKYTYASDIYSIGMLMWEISSGKLPFSEYDNYYYLSNDRILQSMKAASRKTKYNSKYSFRFNETMSEC